MLSRGSLMCHFSGILGSTLAENSSIRFAIVENLYESSFLILNSGNWQIDFSQNRAPWSGHIFCKVRHKNSIDPNSCSSRQDESNHHINMGFRNYCWSGDMSRRSCAPPRVEKLNSKTWVRHGFVALNLLYL